MNSLRLKISHLSELALVVMQSVLAKNDTSSLFEKDDQGPLALASALSDFFQIADVIEQNIDELESDEISEFGDYALGMLDRLGYFTRQLEVMDQNPNLGCVYASLAYWLVQRGAVLNNLAGVADGFARMVNGLQNASELAEMCGPMEAIISSASESIQADEDKSNTWRPWRIINLNAGIAATRSLDPQLMEATFARLSQRLPQEMSGFFSDGSRQMIGQEVPDEVRTVMNRYRDQWTDVTTR
ncbi:MAG: hypothetical protein ACI9FD_004908 [Gammaproteobacteria bacterium]|jgi:hypothetical protein